MSAISDQKLADSFTSSAQIGDDSRSNLSVNVTDHDDQTGSMSPSLSGTFSNRTRPTRSGSIRTNRSMSKDPISSGGNNGSTPNLASTVNGGSRSFSASTDDVASPSLSATKSPGKASLPPSATFNSGTRGRNASASIDIDRSRQNVGPTAKAWEAELEMLLKVRTVFEMVDLNSVRATDPAFVQSFLPYRTSTSQSRVIKSVYLPATVYSAQLSHLREKCRNLVVQDLIESQLSREVVFEVSKVFSATALSQAKTLSVKLPAPLVLDLWVTAGLSTRPVVHLQALRLEVLFILQLLDSQTLSRIP